MKKLKIAFYTDVYLPTVDGTVNSIVRSRKELERRGHKVYVFTAGGKDAEDLEKKDKRLVVLKGMRFRRYPQYTIALKPNYRLNLRDVKPDIIHFHTPFNMGVLAIHARNVTGAKLVSTFHTLIFSDESLSNFFSKNRIIKTIGKLTLMRYLRWLYKKSDVVISPSNFIKHTLRTKLHLSNDIEVIPSGIELRNRKKAISRELARKELGIGRKEKILLYLGRVSPEKNLYFILKSGKRLEKAGFRIVMAGTGPYLDKCRAISNEKGLKNIYFPGFVSEKIKRYYYAAADVFCNPSTFDTQSLVDLEAMAEGLPILVPEGSAQAEFLEKGACGEVFDKGSEEDMVSKALMIVKNKYRYSPKSVAEQYDIHNEVDHLLEVYYKLLEKRA